MKSLLGKPVAESIYASLKEKISQMKKKPNLVVLLVGEDPASKVYVGNKTQACERLGIGGETQHLKADISQAELIKRIEALNADSSVYGILVQLPLPKHIERDVVLSKIAPEKDVDGIHPLNMGKLVLGQKGLVSCTPSGVMEMLRFYQIPVSGKRAVVIGRSEIVGKPMAQLLIAADATVTVCHSRTQNLKEITQQADVLIVAMGKPKAITAEYIKPGATVIDVGIHRQADGKLCGDVDTDSVNKVAGALSPVPGGVGPMTIAMLMNNLIQAAQK